ncbi:hypothetical protein ACTQ33_03880 [Candidatus Avoscillospira sp. LCP25S3_F1]|uniref:hypothetical protein n=1 Tax=Candidatus Avoscillospira sp. LCP25S3_F1 TaxID=3438825 RepID=UPI003F8F52BE
MKKYQTLNTILNCIIGSFLGVFLARSVYTYWDYTTHPDLYAVSSAPWYTTIQIFGIIVAIIVGVAVVLKILIRKKASG